MQNLTQTHFCCGPFVNQNDSFSFFSVQGNWAWLSKKKVFARGERLYSEEKSGQWFPIPRIKPRPLAMAYKGLFDLDPP